MIRELSNMSSPLRMLASTAISLILVSSVPICSARIEKVFGASFRRATLPAGADTQNLQESLARDEAGSRKLLATSSRQPKQISACNVKDCSACQGGPTVCYLCKPAHQLGLGGRTCTPNPSPAPSTPGKITGAHKKPSPQPPHMPTGSKKPTLIPTFGPVPPITHLPLPPAYSVRPSLKVPTKQAVTQGNCQVTHCATCPQSSSRCFNCKSGFQTHDGKTCTPTSTSSQGKNNSRPQIRSRTSITESSSSSTKESPTSVLTAVWSIPTTSRGRTPSQNMQWHKSPPPPPPPPPPPSPLSTRH